MSSKKILSAQDKLNNLLKDSNYRCNFAMKSGLNIYITRFKNKLDDAIIVTTSNLESDVNYLIANYNKATRKKRIQRLKKLEEFYNAYEDKITDILNESN